MLAETVEHSTGAHNDVNMDVLVLVGQRGQVDVEDGRVLALAGHVEVVVVDSHIVRGGGLAARALLRTRECSVRKVNMRKKRGKGEVGMLNAGWLAL